MSNVTQEFRNKYTLPSKVQAIQSAVEQLDKKVDGLFVRLLSELQQYLDAHCHGMNGVDGAPGRDGRDGVSIKGDKGDPGDIAAVGNAELQAAVVKLRAEKARVQAAFLVAVDENSKRPHSGLKRVLAAALDNLKRDAGL